MRSRSLFSVLLFFIVFYGCGGVSLVSPTPTAVTNPVEYAGRTRLVGETSSVTPACASSADKGAKVEVVVQEDADQYVRIILNTAFEGEAEVGEFKITLLYIVWLPDLNKFATFGYDEISGQVLYITEDTMSTDSTYSQLRVQITPEANVTCTIVPSAKPDVPQPNGLPSLQG